VFHRACSSLLAAEIEIVAWIRRFGLCSACVAEGDRSSSDGERDSDQNKTAALAHFRLRQYRAEQCARTRDGL
jgi:hypothetical protein